MSAAKVGGILANDTYPADFLTTISPSPPMSRMRHSGPRSEAAFPRLIVHLSEIRPQPIPEDALLTGPLEPTNEWYPIAKIAGIKLAQAYRRQHGANYISAMPPISTALATISTEHQPCRARPDPQSARGQLAGAASFEIWGSGAARREFLHVDDCADALVLLMKSYNGYEHVNVGCGVDVTIAELSQMAADRWASRARSPKIQPSPTERRANCWIFRAFGAWRAPASICPRDWPAPIAVISKTGLKRIPELFERRA